MSFYSGMSIQVRNLPEEQQGFVMKNGSLGLVFLVGLYKVFGRNVQMELISMLLTELTMQFLMVIE